MLTLHNSATLDWQPVLTCMLCGSQVGGLAHQIIIILIIYLFFQTMIFTLTYHSCHAEIL